MEVTGRRHAGLVLPARSLTDEDFELAASELGQSIPGTGRLLPMAARVTSM